MRRATVLIALLTVAGAALTACGSAAGQPNAAVLLGGRTITVDDVQNRLNQALDKEQAARDLAKNHKLDLVSRNIVDQLVRHELITEAAKRDGLTISEKDVADYLARVAPAQDPTQRAIDAAFDPRELAQDRLLTVNYGRKSMDKAALIMNGFVSQDPAFTRDNAIQLAGRMAAQPDKAAEIGKEAAGAANPNPNPQQQQQQTAQAIEKLHWDPISRFSDVSQQAQSATPPAEAMLGQLFAAPANSVIALMLGSGQQGQQTSWLVALISPDPAGVPAELASHASEMPDEWAFALGDYLLGPLAAQLGIQVSPRYGVWDPLAVAVAPSAGETSGVVMPTTLKTPSTSATPSTAPSPSISTAPTASSTPTGSTVSTGSSAPTVPSTAASR